MVLTVPLGTGEVPRPSEEPATSRTFAEPTANTPNVDAEETAPQDLHTEGIKVAESAPPVDADVPETTDGADVLMPTDGSTVEMGEHASGGSPLKTSAWSSASSTLQRYLRGQLGRVLVGGLAGLFVLLILVSILPPTPHSGLAQAPASSDSSVATPTPQPKADATQALTVSALVPRGTVSVVAQVVGGNAHFNAPQEALQLRNGTIAVIDTGNHRLVLLSPTGKVVRIVRGGSAPFQQPYAIAGSGNRFYVLDAQRDAIDRFDSTGAYKGQLIHDPVLHQARGMAVGLHATLLVANPSTNTVETISTTGVQLHHIGGGVGSGPNQLNQPSDVAVGKDGSTFVLDNNNRRVVLISTGGAFSGFRPAPPSSTLASSHMLSLPDGRLLVSDPAGSLLLFPRGAGAPLRLLVQLRGLTSTHISPLGVSLMQSGAVLVTDSAGNRLLEFALPRH